MPEGRELDIEKEFRRALHACKELYRAGGFEIAQYNPELIQETPHEFMSRMLDLERGLVIKIFVAVALADGPWTPQELSLGADLLEHTWGERLEGKPLKKALDSILEQQADVHWDPLFSPFERLAPLRDHADRLQTLVLRLANLVAKVDGHICDQEIKELKTIQADLQRRFERVPFEGPGKHKKAHKAGVQAAQAIASETDRLREKWKQQQADKVKMEPRQPKEELAAVLQELDGLIGLASIKEEVKSLVNFLKMQKERNKVGLPETQITLHAVFTGNPGTGKTTVARLIGRIFAAMGILAKGHLIETDRAGLVAEYAGQTGPKTHARIDEALDGVLFIDEAYSLVAEHGDDPYGAEAVQALLKRMEDDRERLVLILAGYPAPMDRLIKSNPGFSSRFGRRINFPDYSAPELGMIFQSLCRKSSYELPVLTRIKLLLGFTHLLKTRDEHFGNGRLVRNVFERSIGRLANRIAGVVPLTRELLTILEPGDIVMEDVPTSVWDNLDSQTRRVGALCPGCGHASSVPQSYLCQTVRCKHCQVQFCVEWGEILETP
jgi:AAA+ superfamily predicted ATPase